MLYRPEPGKTFDPAQLDREFRGISVFSRESEQNDINAATFTPFKAAMVRWNGSSPIGADDPAVIGSMFNVDTVTRTGVGTYRVFFSQVTIHGINILEGIYPVIELYMSNFTLAYQAVLTDGSSAQGWAEIQVFELVPNGQSLNRINRDMQPADQLWFTATLNFIHPDAEPIPE